MISKNLNKGDSMAKGKDVQKPVKKKSEKTLKEKLDILPIDKSRGF